MGTSAEAEYVWVPRRRPRVCGYLGGHSAHLNLRSDTPNSGGATGVVYGDASSFAEQMGGPQVVMSSVGGPRRALLNATATTAAAAPAPAAAAEGGFDMGAAGGAAAGGAAASAAGGMMGTIKKYKVRRCRLNTSD